MRTLDNYLILIADSTHAATLPDPHSSKLRTVVSLIAVPLASFDASQSVITKHAARQARYRQSVSSIGSVLSAKTKGGNDSDSSSSDSEEEEEEADAAPIVTPATSKRPLWLQRAFSRNKTSTPASSTEPDLASNASTTQEASVSHKKTVEDPNEAKPADSTDSTSLAATTAEATNPSPLEDDADVRESQKELDDKLIAETTRTFRGLYFSFETDITRTLQAKAAESKGKGESFDHLPLWRRADKRFWFNAHLMSSFVAAGVSFSSSFIRSDLEIDGLHGSQLHSYIIVLQQGFAQELTVPLPLQPYQSLNSTIDPDSPTSIDLTLVLISRRSIERPGLRYQRRGINSSGGVANFVETEFIVSCIRDGVKHHCSFVQIRGSIPAYWSQSPWALKPPPVLERTQKDSTEAMTKHIDALEARYGRLVLVNLAEQSGKEGAVVGAFREGMESMNKPEEKVR